MVYWFNGSLGIVGLTAFVVRGSTVGLGPVRFQAITTANAAFKQAYGMSARGPRAFVCGTLTADVKMQDRTEK